MERGKTVEYKSLEYAKRIIMLYKHLCSEKKEFVLSKQLLRSGTSIGANITEAEYGISRKDFLAKMYVAFKECAETLYWLELLRSSGYLNTNEYKSFKTGCDELMKMLSAITKTTKTTTPQLLTPHSSLLTEKGFSLVEMMVALFILTIGLLSAAPLLTMTIGLEAQARSKNAAALAAQNELERLADLYRRNPASEELTIGTHQALELIEIRNPLTQNVLNRYKITWGVGELPDPRPGIDSPGRIISVSATPIPAEDVENTRPFRRKTVTINAVITTEP